MICKQPQKIEAKCSSATNAGNEEMKIGVHWAVTVYA